MSLKRATLQEPELVLEFLRATLPFSEVDEKALASLSKECSVDFLAKGMPLFSQGDEVQHLYLVQKGGVKVFLRDDEGRETLLDYRSDGASVGALAMFGGGTAGFYAETVEDTFFFKMPRSVFLDAVRTIPALSHFYLHSFSKDYVAKAFSDMRTREIEMPRDSGLYLFGSRIGDMASGPPVTIAMGQTIQQAAALMVRQGVGSLLVTDPSGDIIGIVTDKDLRKTLSVGMDYEAPIEVIMSSPVETVDREDICFDALLRMMSKKIHHLAVTRDSEVVGMVTSHDVMVLQGKSPLSLFREILSQRTFEGLYPLSKSVPNVIRTLIEEGAKAGNITRMITVINDLILDRLLTLLLKELGRPPVPFCWLLMGSEGRKEQTFYTDQDNALVYKDVQDEVVQRAVRIYFEAFAERAIAHLIKCGFPPCPGDIMARNPKWCQPYSVWRDYFERWIEVPEPTQVMHAAIFFDFRAGYGHAPFAEELRNHLALHCRRQEVFLRYLAANCLESKPPLSFFRNFIVEKDGEHKNTLDIKKRGLAPMVDFARVLALKEGVRETNTLGRLDKLNEREVISPELYNDSREAYEFLMHLRLMHQLERVEQGMEPNNNIDPKTLSELEKRTLKDAFSVIGRMQSFLKEMFRLNIA